MPSQTHFTFDRPASGVSLQELLSSRTSASFPLKDIMSRFFGIPLAADTAGGVPNANDELLGISSETITNISKLMVKELDSIKRALEDIPPIIGATLLLAYETNDELESVPSPRRLRSEPQAWLQPPPPPPRDDQIQYDQAEQVKDGKQSRLIYAVRLLRFKLPEVMGAEGEDSINLSQLESVREAIKHAMASLQPAGGAGSQWNPTSGSTTPGAFTP